MDHLLHFRVDAHHLGVEIGMISHQDLWVPSRCDEYRIHAATDWRHENLADLQPNQEREGHNYRCVFAAVVVLWLGELEVKKREQSAEIGDERGAHGQYRANQATKSGEPC